LVTLGGSSSSAEDRYLSRSGCAAGAGAVTLVLTGDEDSRSITSFCGRAAGCEAGKRASEAWSCVFTRARDSFRPGLVTFAKL
jgi:hypothetical protein